MGTRPQEVQAGPENGARNSFPLTHSFLLTEVPSRIPSALVPQGSWAQPPAQQWSGTCFFWEGTSHSGGDQPSRVRGGGEALQGKGRMGAQPSAPIIPSPPCSCQSCAALRVRRRWKSRARCSPAKALTARGHRQEGKCVVKGWGREEFCNLTNPDPYL